MLNGNHKALQFHRAGYVVVGEGLGANDMLALQASSIALNRHAQSILDGVIGNGTPLATFYQAMGPELIAVPEEDDAQKVCRFEYLAGTDAVIRERIVPKLRSIIRESTGFEVTLFKDKCNAKNPGGGAFDPHQDVIAYDTFRPRFHITVAVFLDAATSLNGCLNFPVDYLRDLAAHRTQQNHTPVGLRPVLESYEGGSNHGNIRRELSEKIRWKEVLASPGDVIVFDSYVPHYSEKNRSTDSRRAMFFTFNVVEDGEHYEDYYSLKRADFGNPKFHIATPTNFDDAEAN